MQRLTINERPIEVMSPSNSMEEQDNITIIESDEFCTMTELVITE